MGWTTGTGKSCERVGIEECTPSHSFFILGVYFSLPSVVALTGAHKRAGLSFFHVVSEHRLGARARWEPLQCSGGLPGSLSGHCGTWTVYSCVRFLLGGHVILVMVLTHCTQKWLVVPGSTASNAVGSGAQVMR